MSLGTVVGTGEDQSAGNRIGTQGASVPRGLRSVNTHYRHYCAPTATPGRAHTALWPLRAGEMTQDGRHESSHSKENVVWSLEWDWIPTGSHWEGGSGPYREVAESQVSNVEWCWETGIGEGVQGAVGRSE